MKEDRYEAALELARSYYGKGTNEFLDTIFPELRESEDERIRTNLMETIRRAAYSGVHISEELEQKYLAWLEKHKKQKPAEWSREDTEAIIERLKIAYNETKNEMFLDDIKRLKSRRPPQYCENCKLKRSVENWKPSEEQMKALSRVIAFAADRGFKDPEGALESLYYDLKRLTNG